MRNLRGIVFCALAACALAAGLIGVSVMGIVGFSASLNLDRPPIGDVPPVRGFAGAPLARRVVLVILDGLGDRWSRGLPVLDGLRARGVDGTARAHFPTLSLPNYAAILTGVPPSFSGVRSNQYSHLVSVEALTDRVQARGGKVAYVADVSPTLPDMIPGWDLVRLVPWKGLLRQTSLEVLATNPALTVFLLDDCDSAGHREGAASAAYHQAALGYDELMGAVWSSLDPARDTLVIVADHGHLARGGHGGPEPDVVRVPLILAGAGVRAGVVLDDADLADVAPTVAALLGVPAPGQALGRTLVDALDVSARQRSELATADALRMLELHAHLAAPTARSAHRGGRAFALRAALATSVLALLVLILVGLAALRVASFDRRVLFFGVAAFATLVGGFRLAFADYCTSPSFPGDGEPIGRSLLFGAALAGGVLILAWLASRDRPTLGSRLRAALGVASVGLVAGVATAALSFVLGGELLAQRFFGPTLLVALPAFNMITLYQAGAVALILLSELVVYYARATHLTRRRPGPRATAVPGPGDSGAPRRPKVLFILGNNNHTTMLHKVARELGDVDLSFSPYYCDDWTFLDVLRRLHLLEFIPLGNGFRRRCLRYCADHGLRVDLGGKKGGYDLVVTCSDLIVPGNVRGTPLVGVQEGAIDPQLFFYRLRKLLPWLPRWAAGTTGTGLSGCYQRYCVASPGYRDEFVSRGAPAARLVVTGLPNLDDIAAYRKPGHWIEGHVLACTSDGRETFRRDDRPAFIRRAVEIAAGRPLVFKFHPNERRRRAVAEVLRFAPGADYIIEGAGEELAANCEVLLTEWSTLAFVGLALGKETHSLRDLDEMRRLLPVQHGGAAARIAAVCRATLAGRSTDDEGVAEGVDLADIAMAALHRGRDLPDDVGRAARVGDLDGERGARPDDEIAGHPQLAHGGEFQAAARPGHPGWTRAGRAASAGAREHGQDEGSVSQARAPRIGKRPVAVSGSPRRVKSARRT